MNQLEVKKGSTFKNVVREDTAAGDVSLCYETTTTEQGEVKCPTTLRIRIPIFESGAKYELEARLRYELKEGALLFHLRLPERARMLEQAWLTEVGALVAMLEEKGLSVPVMEGQAG